MYLSLGALVKISNISNLTLSENTKNTKFNIQEKCNVNMTLLTTRSMFYHSRIQLIAVIKSCCKLGNFPHLYLLSMKVVLPGNSPKGNVFRLCEEKQYNWVVTLIDVEKRTTSSTSSQTTNKEKQLIKLYRVSES